MLCSRLDPYLQSLLVAFTFLILIFIAAAFLWPQQGDPDILPTQPDVGGLMSCAHSTVRELARYVNRSVSACTDFDRYACSDGARVAESHGPVTVNFVRAVVHPTLQGRPSGLASRALQVLHKTCVVNLLRGAMTPQRVARDVLDAFTSWFGVGAAALDPIAILGATHLTYNLHFAFVVLYTRRAKSGGYRLYFISHDGVQLDYHGAELALDAFIHAVTPSLKTSLNATFDKNVFIELRNLLLEAAKPSDEKPLNGTWGLFSRLLPNQEFDQWKVSVDSVCGCSGSVAVHIENPTIFANQMSVYANVKRRANLVAFLVVLTSVALFAAELESNRLESAVQRSAVCIASIQTHFHLWDMAAVEQLATLEKDAALEALYRAVVASTAAEMKELFRGTAAEERLRKALSSLTPVMPKNLVRPYASCLPAFGNDYVANAFALRSFQLKNKVIDVARSLGSLWLMRNFHHYVTVSHGYVVFAPSVYLEANLECGPGARFLNDHVLGLQLADAILTTLYRGVKPENGTEGLVARRFNCFTTDSDPISDLRYPWLALRIVTRTISGPTGSGQVVRAFWSKWTLTRSQVFYLLFYLRNLCAKRPSSSESEQRVRNSLFVHSFPDFAKSFGCPLRKARAENISKCLLRNQETERKY
ncbi:hypothetical protein V5799_018232 [Amblyomma americanum]|uniref:Uncharacterized protein n=1 Tax=Amblyomma americanum TaxID=6943 RepID=A0AAQ4F009_AMBAM